VRAAAIVLAGGAGSRAALTGNKVYAPLAGRSVLSYSLQTCQSVTDIEVVVVVVRGEDREAAASALAEARFSKRVIVTEGGSSRTASEIAGLDVLRTAERSALDIIAIHDGARPFAGKRLFGDVITTAADVGGAVPGTPLQTPLFAVTGRATERILPDRLVAVQTPQAFRSTALFAAYEAARTSGLAYADTAEAVERHSDTEIALVPGGASNLKITYADDLVSAEALAPAFAAGCW